MRREGWDELEQAVVAVARGHEVLGDQDGDDEGVDGDDAGHDDGNQALLGRACIISWLFVSLREAWTGLTFMIRSGLKVPTPAMPMPDFAVPYAAPRQPKIMAPATPPCAGLVSDGFHGHSRARRGAVVDVGTGELYHPNEGGEFGREAGVVIGHDGRLKLLEYGARVMTRSVTVDGGPFGGLIVEAL